MAIEAKGRSIATSPVRTGIRAPQSPGRGIERFGVTPVTPVRRQGFYSPDHQPKPILAGMRFERKSPSQPQKKLEMRFSLKKEIALAKTNLVGSIDTGKQLRFHETRFIAKGRWGTENVSSRIPIYRDERSQQKKQKQWGFSSQARAPSLVAMEAHGRNDNFATEPLHPKRGRLLEKREFPRRNFVAPRVIFEHTSPRMQQPREQLAQVRKELSIVTENKLGKPELQKQQALETLQRLRMKTEELSSLPDGKPEQKGTKDKARTPIQKMLEKIDKQKMRLEKKQQRSKKREREKDETKYVVAEKVNKRRVKLVTSLWRMLRKSGKKDITGWDIATRIPSPQPDKLKSLFGILVRKPDGSFEKFKESIAIAGKIHTDQSLEHMAVHLASAFPAAQRGSDGKEVTKKYVEEVILGEEVEKKYHKQEAA